MLRKKARHKRARARDSVHLELRMGTTHLQGQSRTRSHLEGGDGEGPGSLLGGPNILGLGRGGDCTAVHVDV